MKISTNQHVENNLVFLVKLFKNENIISVGSLVHIDMSMEAYEFKDLYEKLKPIVYKKIPHLTLDETYSKVYEEEYGGFCDYGILKFDVEKLSQEDILFIKETIVSLES